MVSIRNLNVIAFLTFGCDPELQTKNAKRLATELHEPYLFPEAAPEKLCVLIMTALFIIAFVARCPRHGA